MAEFTIGSVGVHRAEEVRIPNSIHVFTQDEALVERNRHWLYPHFLDDNGGFDLVFQSWIFEFDGRVALVDPCTGNGKPHKMPFFDNLDVPFIERMTATGFRPEDIDFVICTHLHHDHCGWNTQLRGGKWVPTFPNARYIIQQREYSRWNDDRESHSMFVDNEGVFERSVQPVVEAGLVDLADGDTVLIPGLEVRAAFGHTVGHQLLSLDAAGHRALFTGDCFHHPIQLVDPGNPFGEAEDPAASKAMRLRLVDEAADTGALLVPAHLQAPYGVRASRVDGRMELRVGGACDPH